MSKSNFFSSSVSSLKVAHPPKVYTLNSDQADGLVKSIQLIAAKCRPKTIIFKDSIATNWLAGGSGLLSVDVSTLIEQNLDMGFLCVPDLSKSFAALNNSKDLLIEVYDQQNIYSLIAGTSKVKLIKTNATQSIVAPDISKGFLIGAEIQIDDTGEFISKKREKHTHLFVYNNQLSMMKHQSGLVKYFSEAVTGECTGTPDMVLKSYCFLDLPVEKPKIKLIHLNGQVWLITKGKLAVGIEATIYEQLSQEDNRNF